MRPLKLTLNAFGPFSKKQEIDFETYASDEIFLITGETGAGKTTVFDGICFALYGSASGDARKPSAFQSDHAPMGELCFAELTFRLRGEKYFVRRTPAQRGIKRDGAPKEITPSAELILPDGEVVTGSNAVTERIAQILGLDYRQFKQTTMLAQGEFKQLIEATGKEKQQVFSKIFGTSVYAELTSRLVQEEAALGRETQALQDRIGRCIRELAGYGHGALAVPEAEFMQYRQIEAAVSGTVLLHTEKSRELDAEIAKLEHQKEKLNPESAKKRNEKLERRDSLRREYELLAAKKTEMADAENTLKKLKAVAELSEQEKIILSSKSQMGQRENQIKSLESALLGLEKQKQALKTGEETPGIVQVSSMLDAKKSRYDKLYRDFIDGQAALLSKGLKYGMPCPVCGSKSHPSPTVHMGGDVTEAGLNAAKADVDKLQAQLVQAKEKLESERFRLKNDYDTCIARLETQKSNRDELKAIFETRRTEFLKRLKESGFSRYEDYSRAKEQIGGIEALEKDVAAYNEKLLSTSSRLEEIERDTKGQTREDWNLVIDEYEAVSRRLIQLREDRTELGLMITGSNARLMELRELHAENDEAARKYRIAHKLASLAKGNRTVSFERYVLASYFDDILKLANIHMQRMTNARYKLKRRDDTVGCTGSGLDMEIIDSYTGKIRDVYTLSGGESFKASLALALGLSGVVQIYSGGVTIDTMFIDEGFGSLDERSLESAVETLVTLKKSGRMVGIISHVAALRDYIPKKLSVRYSPTGSAAEWV